MIPTTITIGKKITQEDLEKAGFKVGTWAADMLKKVTFGPEQEIDLVVKTVAELGLKDGGTLKEIYEKAKEQGLELCPAEVGPALRLAYPDQDYGEWLRVAMEPITGAGGHLEVFSVGHGGDDRWLYGYCGNPDYTWSPDILWVFRLPRKSLSTKHSDSQTLPLVTLSLTASENIKKGAQVIIENNKIKNAPKVKICKECKRAL